MGVRRIWPRQWPKHHVFLSESRRKHKGITEKDPWYSLCCNTFDVITLYIKLYIVSKHLGLMCFALSDFWALPKPTAVWGL